MLLHRDENEIWALLGCHAAQITQFCTDESRQPIGPIFKGPAVHSSWASQRKLQCSMYIKPFKLPTHFI